MLAKSFALILVSHGFISFAATNELVKPKWYDELIAAIKADDVDSLERIFSTNSLATDVALNVNSSTPLMVASSLGSRESVRWLLGRGALVNARSGLKDREKPPGVADCTPLHMASARNHLEIARLLIDHDADLSQRDGNGNTPFMIACAKGHLETVKLLMEHGANIEKPNGNGWTAFLVAVSQNQFAVAKFLLDQGANMNAEFPNGRSALMQASESGNEQLVNLLIEKGSNVNHTDSTGSTALIDAAVEGRANIVTLLIQKGAEMNRQNKEGWTALMEAAAHGHCETVKVLCKSGADASLTNYSGRAAFDYAKGITGTKVLAKNSNLRSLIENGSIKQEDRYYVMLRIRGEGDFDCVTKTLGDYQKNLQDKPRRGLETGQELHH